MFDNISKFLVIVPLALCFIIPAFFGASKKKEHKTPKPIHQSEVQRNAK